MISYSIFPENAHILLMCGKYNIINSNGLIDLPNFHENSVILHIFYIILLIELHVLDILIAVDRSNLLEPITID